MRKNVDVFEPFMCPSGKLFCLMTVVAKVGGRTSLINSTPLFTYLFKAYMTIPSLRQVLMELCHDIQPVQEDAPVSDMTVPSVTIEPLPKSTQTALLALHQIYPQLLLASLDLLDTGLVTRYLISSDEHRLRKVPSLYYVRSSQSRSSRHSAAVTSRSVYEVRPTVWHCTCPAFAFSAFSPRNAFDPYEYGTEDSSGLEHWGGEMRGGQIAICKHLLAVVLGERLNVIPEKEVDKDTLANYAFGPA